MSVWNRGCGFSEDGHGVGFLGDGHVRNTDVDDFVAEGLFEVLHGLVADETGFWVAPVPPLSMDAKDSGS